jgi:hypothetical protein
MVLSENQPGSRIVHSTNDEAEPIQKWVTHGRKDLKTTKQKESSSKVSVNAVGHSQVIGPINIGGLGQDGINSSSDG